MKSLIFILLLALGFFYPAPVVLPEETQEEPIVQKPVEEIIEIPAGLNPSQTALYILAYKSFRDRPEMLDVIKCESKFRQHDSAGNPLWSETSDVGLTQINVPTWGSLAKEKGLDIWNDPEDNIAMAKIVLEEQGIEAWTCYK